jgi:hypothetical protein
MDIGAPLQPRRELEDSSVDDEGESIPQKRAAPDIASPSHQGEAKKKKKK